MTMPAARGLPSCAPHAPHLNGTSAPSTVTPGAKMPRSSARQLALASMTTGMLTSSPPSRPPLPAGMRRRPGSLLMTRTPAAPARAAATARSQNEHTPRLDTTYAPATSPRRSASQPCASPAYTIRRPPHGGSVPNSARKYSSGCTAPRRTSLPYGARWGATPTAAPASAVAASAASTAASTALRGAMGASQSLRATRGKWGAIRTQDFGPVRCGGCAAVAHPQKPPPPHGPSDFGPPRPSDATAVLQLTCVWLRSHTRACGPTAPPRG